MENITYEEFIQNILDTRGRFACGEEYHERHHIVPKGCGGNDEEENLIDLYAREHFEAHRLLALDNPNNDKLVYAWWCMSTVKSEYTKERYEISATEYEEARIAISQIMKERVFSDETCQKMSDNHADFSGENNPMHGRPWWDENTPQEKIDEWKIKISNKTSGENNPMFGRAWFNEDTPQEKIDSWKKHMSESKFGNKNPRYNTGIHVVQLTMDNKFISEYISATEAEKQTGINASHIRGVYKHLRGRKSAGGYNWVTKEEWEEMQRGKEMDSQA